MLLLFVVVVVLCRSASEKFAGAFRSDRVTNLITRLQYNVIRTGLRRINLAYSRISLKVSGSHGGGGV